MKRIESLVQSRELPELQALFEKDIIEIEKKIINPRAFRGVKYFTDEEIESDIAEAERLNELFLNEIKTLSFEEQQVKVNGRLIEKLFPDVIERYGWLGENIKMIYTSLYDDYKRKVDSVAQIVDNKNPNHVGFEIDFTSSEKEREEKSAAAFEALRSGWIYKVKYFDSPLTGKLKNLKMPRVIFGVPFNTARDFADLYVEERMGGGSNVLTKKIAKHPLRETFIKYTTNQLQNYAELAQRSSPDYAALHRQTLASFKQVALAKK